MHITDIFKFAVIFSLINICKSDIIYYLIGAVTDSSFRIKAKSTDGSPITVYLNDTDHGTMQSNAQYYDYTVSNLSSNTSYILDFSLNEIFLGYNIKITTFPKPNGPEAKTPFTFIASSYMYTGSRSFVYDKIKNLNPSFFMLLGNIDDSNIKSNNWQDYEKAYLDGIIDII